MGAFSGRKEDLSAAYDRYADMLYRVALSQLQNREDAQDAVQDVFIKYIDASPVFRDLENERAWFVRVTVNRCFDLLRRRKLRGYVQLDSIAESIAAPEGESEHAIQLIRRISEIEEKNRVAIVLHYLEGFSMEEIAKILKISVSAVKMRISRGREKLRNLADKENEDVSTQ